MLKEETKTERNLRLQKATLWKGNRKHYYSTTKLGIIVINSVAVFILHIFLLFIEMQHLLNLFTAQKHDGLVSLNKL